MSRPFPLTAASRAPSSDADAPATPTATDENGDGPVPRLTGTVVGRVLALFFASRLLVIAVAALSRTILLRGPFDDSSRSLWRTFARWDATWYLSIAADGYWYKPGTESSVAFYPLFPLLIRGLSHLGVDPLLAGYGVANLSLVGACFLLWRLTALETRSEGAAHRSVLFLLFFPGTVWCSIIYTEGLFLWLTLGCLLAARRRHWLAAAALGYLGALTRTPGLLTAVFLGVEAVQQWWDDRRAAAALGESRPTLSRALVGRWQAIVGVLAPVLGHATYLGFLQWRFGDWRAQQRSYAAGWNIPPFQNPWQTLQENWQWRLEPFFRWVAFPLLGLIVGLGVLALFAFRRKGYGVLALVLVALLVSSANYHDFARYTTTIVPVYLVLGYVADRVRVLETPLLVFSVMLLTLITALLANGYHIN